MPQFTYQMRRITLRADELSLHVRSESSQHYPEPARGAPGAPFCAANESGVPSQGSNLGDRSKIEPAARYPTHLKGENEIESVVVSMRV